MTDDEREGFEQEHRDQAGDPAQAFEELRQTIEKQGAQLGAEMTVIRRGVEAAFDQFEKFQQPADYGPDLGRIVQQLTLVTERLEGVEQSPILRQGPEHYARALERSGDSLVRMAADQLENKGRDLERAGLNLAGHVKSARERHIQNRHLWISGAVGIVAGVLLTLFVPNMLPGQIDTRVAGYIMAQDRWQAGMALMQAHNESRFNDFAYADALVQANAEAVAACYRSAEESGQEQQMHHHRDNAGAVVLDSWKSGVLRRLSAGATCPQRR